MSEPRQRLRQLLAGTAPLIAVPFTDAASDEEAEAARTAGLDIAEIRIDLFSTSGDTEVAAAIGRFRGLPTIATVRSAAEGGRWQGTEAERLVRYRRVMPLVDAIDVEAASREIVDDVVAAAAAADVVTVLSHHDFQATPSLDRLRVIATEARAAGADLVKVATLASDEADLQTLAAFTIEQASQGVSVVAMGRYGPASRVLLPCLGSRVTYASSAHHVVSGQLSFEQTFEALRRFSPEFDRYQAMRAETRADGEVFGRHQDAGTHHRPQRA